MDDEKTILFVDDEKNILTSLRRLLRKEHWNLRFASSGKEGLEILSQQPIDLVVSDMRMPEMSGSQFLKEVKASYPDTLRVILTGYADRESVQEVLREEYSQQMITKPWDEDQLKATLGQLLDQGEEQNAAGSWLKKTISGLSTLPTLPDLYVRIQDMLSDDSNAPMKEIAEAIERDPTIAIRLLRWSNSAVFGQANRVETVHRSLVVLGTEMVQGLVLTMSVADSMGGKQIEGFDQKAFWDHCTGCGVVAREIARPRVSDQKAADRVFTAALLHDIGKLVELHYSSELFATAVNQARSEGTSLRQQEQAVFGTTHAVVGGYLAEWWNLPPGIQQPVRWHHAPRQAVGEAETVNIVHVADALTHKFEVGKSGNFSAATVDQKIFDSLEFSQKEINDLKTLAQNASLSR